MTAHGKVETPRDCKEAIEIRQRAKDKLRQRQMRQKYLPSTMFGEIAYEILLQLVVIDDDHPINLEEMARLVRTPLPTVARWVDYLEREEFVTEDSSQRPSGRRIILAERGKEAMIGLLAA